MLACLVVSESAMKHAGSSVITVGAQYVQRLIYPMLQQRFDYPPVLFEKQPFQMQFVAITPLSTLPYSGVRRCF